VASLNDYLQKFATQHAKRDVSRTFVALAGGENPVVGYYALSTGSMVLEELPEAQRRRLPRHPIPTAHIGRLAVDKSAQGQGLGEILIFDALQRVVGVSEEMGLFSVTVDAINSDAKSFYSQYGFVPIVGDQLHLYLELRIIRKLLERR
jgi:ribosomal protein S18 acetylase RimI-like enzyme